MDLSKNNPQYGSMSYGEDEEDGSSAGRKRSHDAADFTPLVTSDELLRSMQQLQQQQPTKMKTKTASIVLENPTTLNSIHGQNNDQETAGGGGGGGGGGGVYLQYIIYALINVIISVPGLIGYAAVIFSHPVFAPHMNALAKVVIFSSLVHQLGFTLFSSLPFAIGTVQDAGLIFLASMSNQIAETILAEAPPPQPSSQSILLDDQYGRTGTYSGDYDDYAVRAILSTTLVLLPLGTACLGLVLVFMGYFRMADAVSYLPMPVVGGYLAFIGYFCLQAGVALSVSVSMTSLTDWAYLWQQPKLLLLAAPGLVAALLLTYLSRKQNVSDAALPMAMVSIPAVFYLVLALSGVGMEGAREGGWVGPISPPVPVGDLFQLVELSLVRWDLIVNLLLTWLGMVFVVSFASCLDVAAISMDMGEALDTNRELTTVGVCNVMSGLTFGFTGSYIFSQTIFTYRTGVQSRWVGLLIMLAFLYVVVSPINLLQVAPLFFLGSTLIFIGYDLLYEWLIEIRSKILLSEYAIVWATFLAIQLVGMDAGIVVGILVAIVDHVVSTAHNTTVYRVSKRSRATRPPSHYKILQNQAYDPQYPRIVTLEVSGSVFFGSSFLLLQKLTQEIGIDLQSETDDTNGRNFRSPHTSSYLLTKSRQPSPYVSDVSASSISTSNPLFLRRPPKFVVLDFGLLSNLDASASRGCFLQLAKLCAKHGILLCASGASVRVDWMLRSHEVAYDTEEVTRVKSEIRAYRRTLHNVHGPIKKEEGAPSPDRLLLFLTVHEALEFCENALLAQLLPRNEAPASIMQGGGVTTHSVDHSLAATLTRILGCSEQHQTILQRIDSREYHQTIEMKVGQTVFTRHTHPDSFYIVLKGAVAVTIDESNPRHRVRRNRQAIISGAGLVRQTGSYSNLLDPAILEQSNEEAALVVSSFWPVGGVFGYVDFLLDRPRTFHAVATQDGTVLAVMKRAHLEAIAEDDISLDALIQKVLLQASILDLANCSCDE